MIFPTKAEAIVMIISNKRTQPEHYASTAWAKRDMTTEYVFMRHDDMKSTETNFKRQASILNAQIHSGIARRGYASVLRQAWPDRYFKTSSQKVQQYGRVRHSPTDALKQIHKNCKHMAELGMAQPKSNYFVCRVMQSGMLLISQYGNARSHTSALPHGRARKQRAANWHS